jgi:hypothetical protein
MIEIDRLSEFINDYQPLKNAIDNAIKDKMFIRRGFKKDIHKFGEEYQLFGINYLLKDSSTNFVCVSVVDTIEWTPVKLFQSLYFVVKLYDKFWVINRDNYKCSIISVIHMKDYIKYIYDITIEQNASYLDCRYLLQYNEYRNSLIKLMDEDVVSLKQVSYDTNKKINHYLYKRDNNIYYMSIAHNNNSISVFKPILICAIQN